MSFKTLLQENLVAAAQKESAQYATPVLKDEASHKMVLKIYKTIRPDGDMSLYSSFCKDFNDMCMRYAKNGGTTQMTGDDEDEDLED